MNNEDTLNQTVETGTDNNAANGWVLTPLATIAALDSSTFSAVNATDAIPATWEERARKAWEYYTEEPLVKNCVNSWRTFAVGDEIRIASDDDAVKTEANDLAARLRVSRFVKDMILQLLVKGDAVGFKRYTKDGKDIEQITCVNPISIKVKYSQGELIEVQQFPDDKPSAGAGIDLPVEQTLHLKWDAPEFSPRGNSIVLPAFQSIELLRHYRHAEEAIAKRWATPLRIIKVEDKVKEVKEDIVVALGLSRSLVSGDGPNFATASVSMRKMVVMIREITQAARTILDWIYDDWLELAGHEGKGIHFLFNDLDPTDAVDFKKLLIELYDRKLISRSSLQMKMDLDPEIEEGNRQNESKSADLLDEKQVKPIVDMVVAGIMSIESAQQMLGLDPAKNPVGSGAAADWAGLFTQANFSDKLCDDCGYFGEDNNRCGVTSAEVTFDTSACRFLRPKKKAIQ